MGPENQRLSPDERGNLVAYLDEELPESEKNAIDNKLAHSATARRELDLLRRTWDLLDHLPRAEASEGLSTRTVSVAYSLVTNEERIASSAAVIARKAGRGLAWSAIMLVSFALGFVLVRWVWPNPTSRLASRLSIAEHLEEYEDVGTFEFLDLLEHSPHF